MITGLTTRALIAWTGTDRLSALPDMLPDLVGRPITPGSAMLALFVGGAAVPAAWIRNVDALVAADLVDVDREIARAMAMVLPLGKSLMICDRMDGHIDEEYVCWPDDSSHHLANSLPAGRVARWLDLGCGSGFSPLARPELAEKITCIDLNPRAVRYARQGAELSKIGHIEVRQADVGAVDGQYELVTCNAPIPDSKEHMPMWQTTSRDFFDRLVSTAQRCVAPGGLIVLHAWLAAIPEELPGDVEICSYTPDDDFGIVWWRPDAPQRRGMHRRLLTAERPHLDASDRDPC
jgi:SAM-dependent methyltransferase